VGGDAAFLSNYFDHLLTFLPKDIKIGQSLLKLQLQLSDPFYGHIYFMSDQQRHMAPVISTNVRKPDNNMLRCQNMYHIFIVAHIYMELSRSTLVGCPFYVAADILHVRRMFVVYFITRKPPVEATLVYGRPME